MDPPPPVQEHTAIATYRNDNAHSGINTAETTLTPANVNVVSFGKKAVIPVEGDVYAQPLYFSNIVMADGTTHNIVLIATEHDQVYAVDADTQAVLWQRSFLDANGQVTPVPSSDTNCNAINTEIGITGTPVIDPTTQTAYMVVRTKETQNGQAAYLQRLHAIHLTNGQDRVTPSVIVNPPSSLGNFGNAQFDPLLNMQRSALLLTNGQIYVTWASHCDYGAYTGWLMSFDQTTLGATTAWTPDPSGMLGGIWMGANGPATDSTGDIYLVIGNGWSDAMTGGSNYADSVVRLHPGTTRIGVADWFIPFDYQNLSNEDYDLGAGGSVLLPDQPGTAHPHLLATAGKDGTVYLLDRDNLGKWHSDEDSQIVQSFQNDNGLSYGTPIFWNNTFYFAFAVDAVEAFSYDPVAQQISPTPVSTSGSVVVGYPGASPVLSANGSSSGILWLLEVDRYWNGGNATLRAFDATNLSTELYDSDMSPDRDQAGLAIKFTVPTVINGHVFVGSHNEVDVYGLL